MVSSSVIVSSEEPNLYSNETSLSSPQSKNVIKLTKLRTLNLVAAVFQALTGIIVMVMTKSEKSYAWYTNFPQVIQDAKGNPFGAPLSNETFAFATGYLAGVFLFLSALDHIIVATLARSSYEKNLGLNRNVYRWVEYSVSASIMRVLIALLSGIGDIHTLFLLFGLTACTMLFGMVFELENASKRDKPESIGWASFYIAFIPHAFTWLTIFCFFFRGVSISNPPTFVWTIIVIEFILDLTFAINMLLQWKSGASTGKFKDYVYGEYIFIILSFTSKQLLAWLCFIGGNR